MLIWNEDFATGSALLDVQHRILIDKVNQLETLLGAPAIPKADANELIDFLDRYTKTHFRFEEQCTHRHRCPAYEPNQKAHAAFVETFGRFKEQYAVQGPDRRLLQDLHNMISNWIRNHILSLDVRLMNCGGRGANRPSRHAGGE